MASHPNRRILLATRPDGRARQSDFELVETAIPAPKEGEVLLRNTLISMDPYQRNLMGNGSSELPPMELGTPMSGPTVAIVEESHNPDFAKGDYVQTWTGWQDYAISDGSDLRTLDPGMAPLSTALGVLGHTGLTAWVGMTKYLDDMPGGTFVVSAAAGSVGSMVAQMAKLRDHRVVGIAGGARKIAYLRDEIGVDAAVDYKADDFEAQLARALPDGVDRFFDNVGDYMFEAVMPHFNLNAQAVICGTIAGYSDTGLPDRRDHLPRLLNLILYRFIQVRGFSILDHLDSYPAFLEEVAPWVTAGRIKYREEFIEDFERIPETFLTLFEGGNTGKLIARVG
ncbi:NADP-dependent oxidoreductase [Celeribacter indicus]|uniref:Alcohol dehydrogenase zinc-binding domain protein n=1 Tax=Celeribacter indicus TaxID=1208324 RepID=A0A0B5DQJ8_9RHOB|nr:NADP-dependent oxidoreductase [Celeribacter indicus]AJE45803.1 alcohol dehydrogenase zinc-binding domain protein [Celeribacter indicus]SDW61041.1 hypothetical protein SAMN05443573_10531 [Celeribacter indicus]